MSNVSNQLPYKELAPLPVQREHRPWLYKTVSYTFVVLPLISYSVCMGAAMGLAEWGFSVMTGAIGGGIVGVVAGIAYLFFSPVPSRAAHWRVDTLNQIEPTLAHGKAIEAAHILKQWLGASPRVFPFPYTSHYLHEKIARITEKIEKERPDIVKVWTGFLKHVDGLIVKNPDGTPIVFDLSLDLDRLEKKKVTVVAEPLQKGWLGGIDEKALKEIEQIQEMSFSKEERLSSAEVRKRISQGQALIVRRNETGEVLGYCLYHEEGKGVMIDQVARHPKAAHLAIGSTLLYALIKKQIEDTPIQAKCRAQNPALRHFQNWKFGKKEELKEAYQNPKDDGILLELNWADFKKIKLS